MRMLVLTVPADEAELAADRLWSAGARAVEERAATVADPDRVELSTLLAADDEVAVGRLGPIPLHWSIHFVDVDDAPSDAWRDHARPIEVHPGLIIRPAWLPRVARADVLEIDIEPAGSFGLGDHPTTRLSAAAVDRIVGAGDRVLDVGCGSGVLAIIAARRGACEVVATDIAEPARAATVANVERNEVASIVRASTDPIDSLDGSFDLVVANILAPTLVAMADDLRRLTAESGVLVVSGILADRHDHVLAALEPMRVVGTAVLDGWAAVELRHR